MTWRNWLEALLIVGMVIGLISLLSGLVRGGRPPTPGKRAFDALRSFAGASPERSADALGEGALLCVDLSSPSRLWYVMYLAHEDRDGGPRFSMFCKVVEADTETEARALAYGAMYKDLPVSRYYDHDLSIANIPMRSLLRGLPDEIRVYMPLLLDIQD